MTSLLLCIACSSLLVFMFRVFDHFRVEAFPAIVFNYLTCVCCGLLSAHHSAARAWHMSLHADWLWLGIIMGIAYIHIFVLIGSTALRFGVSTASVAMKLGLVIPVLFAFMVYHEPVTWYKVTGIICALIAVVLCSLKDEAGHSAVRGAAMMLPLVVFAGSGLCDSGAQLGDKIYFAQGGSENFVLVIFLFAGITGICYLSCMLLRAHVRLHWRQVIGGVALGLPNYGSLLYLMRSLDQVPGGSSVVFPVVNIATVAGSTLLSVLIFREHLNRANRIGLIFAGLCILFIYLPQLLALVKTTPQ